MEGTEAKQGSSPTKARIYNSDNDRYRSEWCCVVSNEEKHTCIIRHMWTLVTVKLFVWIQNAQEYIGLTAQRFGAKVSYL